MSSNVKNSAMHYRPNFVLLAQNEISKVLFNAQNSAHVFCTLYYSSLVYFVRKKSVFYVVVGSGHFFMLNGHIIIFTKSSKAWICNIMVLLYVHILITFVLYLISSYDLQLLINHSWCLFSWFHSWQRTKTHWVFAWVPHSGIPSAHPWLWWEEACWLPRSRNAQ